MGVLELSQVGSTCPLQRLLEAHESPHQRIEPRVRLVRIRLSKQSVQLCMRIARERWNVEPATAEAGRSHRDQER